MKIGETKELWVIRQKSTGKFYSKAVAGYFTDEILEAHREENRDESEKLALQVRGEGAGELEIVLISITIRELRAPWVPSVVGRVPE
jgi:hypothetical protein